MEAVSQTGHSVPRLRNPYYAKSIQTALCGGWTGAGCGPQRSGLSDVSPTGWRAQNRSSFWVKRIPSRKRATCPPNSQRKAARLANQQESERLASRAAEHTERPETLA